MGKKNGNRDISPQAGNDKPTSSPVVPKFFTEDKPLLSVLGGAELFHEVK